MKRKLILLPPLPTETTWNNARKWLNIIRYGESGTVIQLQDDCEYRIPEVIENRQLLKTHLGPYYKKYLLAYLPIDDKNLHEAIRQTLLSMCEDKKIGSKGILFDLTTQELIGEMSLRGYEIGLFISHITHLLSKERRQELVDLELMVRTSKNLSVIVFSERDITHPDYTQLADKCSFLFDHVQIYPLYTSHDSRQFLTHYASKWDFLLPEKTTKEIIEYCGGYLWLLHEIERTLRDNPDMCLSDALQSPNLIRKLISIWSKFTPKEQHILRTIHMGTLTESDMLSHEWTYLTSIRAIVKKNNAYTLGIPLLSTAIERDARRTTLSCTRDTITIGSETVTKVFSNQEHRFLGALVSARSMIVPRDTVAAAIWGADWEQKYSDWAIDRIAHRVRSKLKKFGPFDTMLKTIKRKGFLFE